MPLFELQSFDFADAPPLRPVPQSANQETNPLRNKLGLIFQGAAFITQALYIGIIVLEAFGLIFPYLLVLGAAYAVANRFDFTKNLANKILEKTQKILNNNVTVSGFGFVMIPLRLVAVVFGLSTFADDNFLLDDTHRTKIAILLYTANAVFAIAGRDINNDFKEMGIVSSWQSPIEMLSDLYNKHVAPQLDAFKQRMGLDKKKDESQTAATTNPKAVPPELRKSVDWQFIGAAAANTAYVLMAPAALHTGGPIIPAFVSAVGAAIGYKSFEANGSKKTLLETITREKPRHN